MIGKGFQKRLENISENLKSVDIQFQSAALNSFIDLLVNEPLTTEQKKIILPFAEQVLKESESSLRTDCFKAVCAVGAREFSLITHIFPIIFQELELKNRFRTEIVMEMMMELRNSKNPLIQDSMKKVIKETPKWFDESFLIPIIKKFWESSTSQSFQFLDKYLDEINNSIVNYPDNMREIKDLILQKINDYNSYLKQIQAQREKEAKIKAEQEKIREEIEKKREIEKQEMEHKLEKYVKSISTQKTEISGVSPGFSHQEEPYSNEKRIEEKIIGVDKAQDIQQESPTFKTFTNLGLKRKKIENDED